VEKHGWWPSWSQDTMYWVAHCLPCQARKGSGKHDRMPQVYRELPPYPFHTVDTDVFGPLPLSAAGNMYIHVFICRLTGLVAVFAVRAGENTAVTAAELLVDEYSTIYGMPRCLHSDRGTQYTAEIARAVYTAMGVRKLYTTAYHPQANGKAERFMQTLAHMLAMAVDRGHSNWDKLIKHVAFAHNSHVNRSTGFSPYMLVMGREPRTSLHCVLGDLESQQGQPTGSAAAIDIVQQFRKRQLVAFAMLHQRAELKRQQLLRDNARLATAFNLRWDLSKGDLAWVYQQPMTHVANTQEQHNSKWRATLSKKFLDHWSGPFKVLAVGPIYFGDELVQSNVVMLDAPGGPTRVAVGRTKRCRDPAEGSPEGLPSGFARYLLSRDPLGAAAPASLTADDVTWSSDRHGVEAVVAHRVLRDVKGRPGELEYLVRWEGDHMADTWERADLLDACEGALAEYWNTASVSGAEVADASTSVVQGRIKQARQRASDGDPVARLGGGKYKLPMGVVPARVCPTPAVMASEGFVGTHVLMRWHFPDRPLGDQLVWCEGTVRRGMAAEPSLNGNKKQRKQARATVRVLFYGEPRAREVPLVASRYATEQDAPKDAWFIIGTAESLARLTGANSKQASL
jgi:Chromo (CHRromatin Organisation MOdifier) domain